MMKHFRLVSRPSARSCWWVLWPSPRRPREASSSASRSRAARGIPSGPPSQRLMDKEYGDKVSLDIGGGVANALNSLSGKIAMGLTFASTVSDALKGRGPFKGKGHLGPENRRRSVQPDDDLGGLGRFRHHALVTAQGQARQRHAQAILRPGHEQADAEGSRDVLQGFAKTLHLGFNDSVSQMKDGHIDAYMGPGEKRYAPLIQLAAHKPIRILNFTNEDVRKIRSVSPPSSR